MNDDLAERELVLHGPRRDHVNGRPALLVIGGTAEGFAIDRNHPVLGHLLDGLDPTQQAFLEGPRIEAGQDSSDGIFRGNVIGQIKVAGKPTATVDGKFVNPRNRIGTGKDTADSHEDDVDQRMFASTLHARVLKILEVLLE